MTSPSKSPVLKQEHSRSRLGWALGMLRRLPSTEVSSGESHCILASWLLALYTDNRGKALPVEPRTSCAINESLPDVGVPFLGAQGVQVGSAFSIGRIWLMFSIWVQDRPRQSPASLAQSPAIGVTMSLGMLPRVPFSHSNLILTADVHFCSQ